MDDPPRKNYTGVSHSYAISPENTFKRSTTVNKRGLA